MKRYRSSYRRCSVRKDVLRNFSKFIGKNPSLFFNEVAGLRPATLLKKRLAQLFSCKFCGISNNTFFTEHLCATASEDTHTINNVCLQKKNLQK